MFWFQIDFYVTSERWQFGKNCRIIFFEDIKSRNEFPLYSHSYIDILIWNWFYITFEFRQSYSLPFIVAVGVLLLSLLLFFHLQFQKKRESTSQIDSCADKLAGIFINCMVICEFYWDGFPLKRIDVSEKRSASHECFKRLELKI